MAWIKYYICLTTYFYSIKVLTGCPPLGVLHLVSSTGWPPLGVLHWVSLTCDRVPFHDNIADLFSSIFWGFIDIIYLQMNNGDIVLIAENACGYQINKMITSSWKDGLN